MAKKISMKHKETNIMRTGYFGFSWTTLFFGPFPALFRSDFVAFVGVLVAWSVAASVFLGLGLLVSIVWAFLYNRYFTRSLLEKGYELVGSESELNAARAAMRMSV